MRSTGREVPRTISPAHGDPAAAAGVEVVVSLARRLRRVEAADEQRQLDGLADLLSSGLGIARGEAREILQQIRAAQRACAGCAHDEARYAACMAAELDIPADQLLAGTREWAAQRAKGMTDAEILSTWRQDRADHARERLAEKLGALEERRAAERPTTAPRGEHDLPTPARTGEVTADGERWG